MLLLTNKPSLLLLSDFSWKWWPYDIDYSNSLYHINENLLPSHLQERLECRFLFIMFQGKTIHSLSTSFLQASLWHTLLMLTSPTSLEKVELKTETLLLRSQGRIVNVAVSRSLAKNGQMARRLAWRSCLSLREGCRLAEGSTYRIRLQTENWPEAPSGTKLKLSNGFLV